MMQPCPFKRKRTVQALKNVAFLKKIKNSTLCIIILLKKDIYNVTKEFYFKLMLFSDLFYSSNILKKKKKCHSFLKEMDISHAAPPKHCLAAI